MTKVVPGRILLDAFEPDQQLWSHRASWITGSESAYALFAKFAALNALTMRDLCELFVIPNERLRGKPHFPKADLRFSASIRTARLGNLLGINAADLQRAFVSDLFPNASNLSSNVLVWCPRCVHQGFHAAAFQLNFHRTCPVHRIELRRACSNCKAAIPYVLHSTQTKPLFTCLNCGADLAEKLRKPLLAISLNQNELALHRDHLELVRFVDTLPTFFNACRLALGSPHLPIAMGKADVYRSCSAFRQFVADVLTSVSSRVEPPQLATLCPTAVFSRPFEPPPVTRGGSLGDDGLKEAAELYRCLRRNVYRKYCRGHSGCIRAAMRSLWWDPHGERIDGFCPTASAYVRWRMQWEGCRIPNELNRPDRARTLFGLVAWLASEAPIGSHLWAYRLDAWIRAHLLASACVDSFAEWQLVAGRAKKSVVWDKEDAKAFRRRHWACSGRGTTAEPAFLFIEQPFQPIGQVAPASGAHYRSTCSTLLRVRR